MGLGAPARAGSFLGDLLFPNGPKALKIKDLPEVNCCATCQNFAIPQQNVNNPGRHFVDEMLLWTKILISATMGMH